MPRRKRWAVSVPEKSYWKLRKLADRMTTSKSNTLAMLIEVAAKKNGIPDPSAQDLENMKPRKKGSAEGLGGVFTF